MKEECFTCRYFDSAWPMGYCKRRAPTINVRGSGSFPMVAPNWWCGDYEQSNDEQSK